MSDGLDVIILDDDPGIGELLSELIESFYTWGEVHCFSELNKAISFTLQLAVRAITEKYLDFAKKLIHNPDFAESVARL